MRSERAAATVADAAQLVTATTLSRLSGVSLATIGNLAKCDMIPRPVCRDEKGNKLWDLADVNLADWISRLQAAGYNRR